MNVCYLKYRIPKKGAIKLFYNILSGVKNKFVIAFNGMLRKGTSLLRFSLLPEWKMADFIVVFAPVILIANINLKIKLT